MSNYSADILNNFGVSGLNSLLAYYRCTDASGAGHITDFSTYAQTATSLTGVTLGSSGLVVNSTDTCMTFPTGSAGGGNTAGVTLPYTTTGPLCTPTQNGSALGIDFNTPFCIEAIVTPPTLSNTSFANTTILSKSSGGNGFNFIWYWDVADGHQYVFQFALNTASHGSIQLNGILWSNIGGTVPTPGTTYHVVASYDGSGSVNGLNIYINGIGCTRQLTSGTTITGTIANSAAPIIGTTFASTNTAGTNVMSIQELAVYNTATPAGFLAYGDPSSNYPTGRVDANNMAVYHSFLRQNNIGPLANPTGVPKVIFEDDCNQDVDGLGDLTIACYLHSRGYINLIAVMSNDVQTASASAMKAVLVNWGINCPVYAYQGGTGTNGAFSAAVQLAFRSWEHSSDLGVLNSVVVTLGGTGYTNGQVINIPGGTTDNTAGHAPTGNAVAQVTVTNAIGGVIQSGGLRVSNPGCYTAGNAPTSPATLAGGATITFTTGSDRGLYPDPQSALLDLFASNSGVYIMNTGLANVDYNFANAFTSTWNSNVAGLLVAPVGYVPSSTAAWYGSSGQEYNAASGPPSSWNWLMTTGSSTVPVIDYGFENGVPVTVANTADAITYMGPVSAIFTGNLSGTTLTVTGGLIGSINVGDYVVGLNNGNQGGSTVITGNPGLSIASGGPTTYAVTGGSQSPSLTGVQFFLSSTANKATVAVQEGFYAFAGPGQGSSNFVYGWHRANWTYGAWMYLAFGINPIGSGHATDCYWGGNAGSMVINTALNTPNTGPSGANQYSATASGAPVYFLRRSATDAASNLFMAQMMQATPGVLPGALFLTNRGMFNGMNIGSSSIRG